MKATGFGLNERKIFCRYCVLIPNTRTLLCPSPFGRTHTHRQLVAMRRRREDYSLQYKYSVFLLSSSRHLYGNKKELPLSCLDLRLQDLHRRVNQKGSRMERHEAFYLMTTTTSTDEVKLPQGNWAKQPVSPLFRRR